MTAFRAPFDGLDNEAKVTIDLSDPAQVEAMRQRLDQMASPPGFRPSMKTLRTRTKKAGGLGASVPKASRGVEVASNRPAFTRIQADAQMHVVEELALNGVRSVKTIQEVVAKKLGVSLSPARVRTLVERVQQRWSFEDSQYRPIFKASAMRRIEKYIRSLHAKAEGDPSRGVDPNPKLYGNLHKFEELLSKIQGTQEPIQLNMNAHVTEAMMNVIGMLDEGTMRSLITEQHALENAYRGKLPNTAMELSYHDTSLINATPALKLELEEPAEGAGTVVDETPPHFDDAFSRATRLVQAHRQGSNPR